METFWRSLRYTLRVLGKNPGFTSVAILSLALSIGANTAIFTLINALFLRGLPVRQPERLVQLSPIRQGDKITFSCPMFREVERGRRVFSSLMAWSTNALCNVEVNGILAQDRVLAVSGNAYSVLGTTPLLGRLLTPDDSNLSAGANPQVAVIGYEFWQRQFGAAPDVVRKQIRIEGHPFTIVGVTRKLKDGVTIEQARAQLQSFWPEVLLASASTPAPGLRRQTFLLWVSTSHPLQRESPAA
jgi:ABC-type antimicrobial peptide transport system permease subunit